MAPFWNHEGVFVSVNLSIKNVPAELARKLKRRATRHHRSLQGELLAILEQSVAGEGKLTLDEVLQETRRLGLRTKAEAADIIRADRDAR